MQCFVLFTTAAKEGLLSLHSANSPAKRLPSELEQRVNQRKNESLGFQIEPGWQA